MNFMEKKLVNRLAMNLRKKEGMEIICAYQKGKLDYEQSRTNRSPHIDG